MPGSRNSPGASHPPQPGSGAYGKTAGGGRREIRRGTSAPNPIRGCNSSPERGPTAQGGSAALDAKQAGMAEADRPARSWLDAPSMTARRSRTRHAAASA